MDEQVQEELEVENPLIAILEGRSRSPSVMSEDQDCNKDEPNKNMPKHIEVQKKWHTNTS